MSGEEDGLCGDKRRGGGVLSVGLVFFGCYGNVYIKHVLHIEIKQKTIATKIKKKIVMRCLKVMRARTRNY